MLRAMVVVGWLVLGAHDAGADAEQLYASAVADVGGSKPRPDRALNTLLGIHHKDLDYRFFMLRAIAFYELDQLAAGDADAQMCRIWYSAATEVDRKRAERDLASARKDSVARLKAFADNLADEGGAACQSIVLKCARGMVNGRCTGEFAGNLGKPALGPGDTGPGGFGPGGTGPGRGGAIRTPVVIPSRGSGG